MLLSQQLKLEVLQVVLQVVLEVVFGDGLALVAFSVGLALVAFSGSDAARLVTSDFSEVAEALVAGAEGLEGVGFSDGSGSAGVEWDVLGSGCGFVVTGLLVCSAGVVGAPGVPDAEISGALGVGLALGDAGVGFSEVAGSLGESDGSGSVAGGELTGIGSVGSGVVGLSTGVGRVGVAELCDGVGVSTVDGVSDESGVMLVVGSGMTGPVDSPAGFGTRVPGWLGDGLGWIGVGLLVGFGVLGVVFELSGRVAVGAWVGRGGVGSLLLGWDGVGVDDVGATVCWLAGVDGP